MGHFTKHPLYSQIQDALAERIATGVWKPGTALPNEPDLAKEFGVSPGTVRKALDQLEQNQLVVRRQGRGTFVIDQTSGKHLWRFVNLRDENGERLLGAGEILEQSVRHATAEEKERLQIDASEMVVWTKRVRRRGDRPLSVEERCLVTSRFPGLGPTTPGDYQIIALAQKCGIHLANATEHVSVSKATPELAQLLSVAGGADLLKLDRVICSSEGMPVERRVAFCHLEGEFYQVEMQ